MSGDLALVRKLEARVEELEFYIAEMRGESLLPPWGIHMTGMELATISLIATRAPVTVTKPAILTALHPTFEQPGIKVVDVYICRVRKILRPLGLTIKTHWHAGVSMTREDGEQWLDWCRARTAGESAPADYPEFDPITTNRRKRNAA